MKKSLTVPLLSVLVVCIGCGSKAATNKWETIEMERVSVHDPSIVSVINDDKEEFYIFGSHLGEAKTTDLVKWQVPFNSEYENMDNNLILGDVDKNLKKSFEWAGRDDADSKGGYSIWAPDVIWLPEYKWKNGDKGAYVYYYSVTSTWRRSAIGFAVSKNIEGPYDYRDTVVYSGFTEVDSTDGSERNTNYEGTNLKDLIDKGTISSFNKNWVKNAGGEYNTDYAPNAIDPALFFDEEGRLWMTYGSWSGGIYLLEMDKETGEAIYPGEDSKTKGNNLIDRYFGVKLSGGYHHSGEGPYIVYDEQTKYYYLFETYGGLATNGGYNMRLFRSENPDGPYYDLNGNEPIPESRGDHEDNYGLKVMGNYQFSNMTKAYKAQGHNSAIIDRNGDWLLAFHTRFSNNGEGHEVRIHPMMMNENDWPVALPYEYTDSISDKTFKSEELVGEYEFITHGTKTEKEINKSKIISLEKDGKITGATSGTWKLVEGKFINLLIDEVSYKGVITEQKNEQKEMTIVFSAVGENETVWGSKK
ncbi:glycoside hydrolase family 43 protein [Vagococcus fluvialis]|uniref:glycoside hydrolase family 43 protein n=1 Tax=Vagococcus fluvialis TaxID=2738 RepID=UPI0030F4672F